jgi:hypothetical protein
MLRISDNITYHEAIYSAKAIELGIDNRPTPQQLANMKLLASKVFEPLRTIIGHPIKINSFYRSPLLNKAIGGATNSQHMAINGAAMDITAISGYDNADLFETIKKFLVFDQLIWEGGNDKLPDWVHVSYSIGKNRNQIIKLL